MATVERQITFVDEKSDTCQDDFCLCRCMNNMGIFTCTCCAEFEDSKLKIIVISDYKLLDLA